VVPVPVSVFQIFDAICQKSSLGSKLKEPKHKIYKNNIVIHKIRY